MKHIYLLLILCCSIFTAQAQFVHPGMLHSKAELDFMKTKAHSGEEPWGSAWQLLQYSSFASLSVTPRPVSRVATGYFNIPNSGGTEFFFDADVAYTMALQWYITGEKKYAEKAIEVLNAWSYTLDSICHDNRGLTIGVWGIRYLNAAEIIKHTYTGWHKADQQQFEKMILEIWYPVIVNFVPHFNGNWDAAISQTMMGIGIFLDRQDIFDRAYNNILKGKSNGAINNYFIESGQCQESGRDQGHVQMGLAYLTNVCEMAWHQGRDLYAAYDNLLAKGYEYTAKYMLGEEVPYIKYKTYQGELVFGDKISPDGRGRYAPIYERVYHHYHDRKGLEMPYTKAVIWFTRNEGAFASSHVPWSTLTTAGFPK